MRASVILFLCVVSSSYAEEDFVPLFNGKNLDGWEIKSGAKNQWSVKDGVLMAKPGTGWLGTKKKYGDFVLRLEWRIPENGNSGVFIRVPDLKEKEQPHVAGMEIQILDDNGPQYKGKLQPWQFSGSLYGIVPPSKSVFKGADKWNSFVITCKGNRIAVVFNGEKIAEADAAKEPKLLTRPKTGYIGLQNHGSSVEFRNIQIKEWK